MFIKLLFLALFTAIMLGVGLYSRRKIKTQQDFLFGGRQMGPWLTAFAYGTTYFSAVIMIGYAGKTGWGFGLSATWIGVGNALVGCLLSWLVLAKRTRKMTQDLNASTMPSFFEKRYDSKAIKIAASIIIFVFLVPYSASVYQGLSYLIVTTIAEPLYELTGIYVSFEAVMLIMAVLTGAYLILGGYVATAINDFIQGIIMLAGMITVVLFIVNSDFVGGLGEGVSRLSQIPDVGESLVKPFSSNPIGLLSLVILTSFGTWGLPQMVHKFYAIKDNDAIKKATIVSTVFAVVISCGAYFVGGFGRLFVTEAEIAGDLDKIVPIMFQKTLPDYVIGLVIVLVLSASMSTLSSLVLVSSSSISLDLIKGTLFPKMKEKSAILLMRTLCVVFVITSFVVAMVPSPIMTLMAISWGTVAGSFLAPFLYGLYWKGTTKAGAWAGIITGFVCSVGGAIIFGTKNSPTIGAVAMLASLIAVPVVSSLTPKFSQKHIDMVFKEASADDKEGIPAKMAG